MVLRNPREGRNGIEPENIIEAVDPRSGKVLCSCTVQEEYKSGLFPERPHHVRLDIEGKCASMESLLGAAMARAIVMCAGKRSESLIYAACPVENDTLLNMLVQLGFRNTDGFDRMYARLPVETETKLPMGSVIIHDTLEDAQEQRYFLDRYNEINNTEYDHTWLRELRSRNGFRRILCVAPTGMVAEVIVWIDDECGVVEFFDTARRWQQMGVGRYMLALACQYAQNSGCTAACADIRRSIKGPVSVLDAAGFNIVEKLVHYPTIEL